jgi:hypothetical protein
MEQRQPFGEGTFPVFLLSVDPNLFDGGPSRVIEVRSAFLTAHGDHLMPGAHEARHEVAADVARSARYDDTHL